MSERVFKRPEGTLAPITYVRASELFEEDKIGPVVEGTFLGAVPNKFNEDKTDFKFKLEDESLIIINGAGNLGYKMSSVNVGEFCQVSYLGKTPMSKGKFKGTLAHSFDVLVA